MSAKDSLPKKQSSNSRKNKQNFCRAFSEVLPPSADLLRSRCDDTEIFGTRDAGEGRVRSQSEIIYSLQPERNGSFIKDRERSQTFYCSSGSGLKECKLPKITQRNMATTYHSVGDRKATATTSFKMPRARSLSVLPDLSRGTDKVVTFRPATPLRQQRVEELNNKFASMNSKSQDLAKWLKDQQ